MAAIQLDPGRTRALEQSYGRPQLPAAVQGMAAYQKLGQFIDTDSAMGGRTSYNFQRGSVLVQGGRITGAEITSDEGDRVTVPVEVLNQANARQYGAFVRADSAMGGRLAYVFERGTIYPRAPIYGNGVG